jgi:hypothetical protein
MPSWEAWGRFTTNNGDVRIGSGGLLSPGASSGALALNLGTGTLDLRAAAESNGWLKFDLGAQGDLITLSSGVLNLGTGFDLADFSFRDNGGFGPGTYLLFDTNTDILGSLGASSSGSLFGLQASLAFANGTNGRDDLILVVVPEPSSLVALFGGLGMLLGGRRWRKRDDSASRSNGGVASMKAD